MGGAGTAPRTPRARDPLDGRLLCWQAGAMGSSAGIGALLGRMEGLLEPLEASGDPGRFFLATYLRTTRAVAEELDRGGFRDPAWVERWDVAFADLYLDAVEDAQAGRRPPEPWAVAFGAGDRDGLPPLRHVLLGMNAHINYDLAQSLLAVISEAEFDDPELLARRHADHEHIDQVLVARVGTEDTELEALSGPRSRTDRLLQPLNRLATKRFLRESRAKVWANTRLLDTARRAGPAAYATRLAELERLAATRVADLTAPGQVVLKLAIKGFGVRLPDA
ncbi:MAG: hypothetical protein K0S88_430 [Actinomycetia bacterium]|nr:hypothetical protein [Actinomycetes bacterium]